MALHANASLSAVLMVCVAACKAPAPARVDPEPARRPASRVVASTTDAALLFAPTPAPIPTPVRVEAPDVAALPAVPSADDAWVSDAHSTTSDDTDDTGAHNAGANDASARPSSARRNAAYSLEVDHQDTCDLRVANDAIVGRCTNGRITCMRMTTGAITAVGATDTLWNCERSTNATHYVVLSTATSVVWGDSLAQVREESDQIIDGACTIDRVSAELVPAGTHPTPAVLVRSRDCQTSESSTSYDNDYLWIWCDGAMEKLTEAQFSCQFSSTRMGRSFGAGMTSCQGDYGVPNAAGAGVNIVGYRVAVRQPGVGADRLMKGNGHIQRRLLWSRMLAPEE